MKTVLSFMLLCGLAVPAVVFGVALNVDYPSLGGMDINQDENQNIPSIVAWLYFFITTISGLAAFVMIVWGGVQWMTSAGNTAAMGDAKDKIQKALMGLLLVLSSFIILQIINPDLVTLRLGNLSEISGQERVEYRGPGSEVQSAPRGQEGAEGIYLCRPEGERAGCDRSATASVDWLRIPLEIVGSALDLDGSPWNDRAMSLGINDRGDLGRRDVLLFESTNFGAEAMCLTGSAKNLHDFRVQSGDLFGSAGRRETWQENIGSVCVLAQGNCSVPRISFDNEGSFNRTNSWANAGVVVYAKNPAEVTSGNDIAAFVRHAPKLSDTDDCGIAEVGWNDRIQYLEIRGDMDVLLYEHNDWEGKVVCLSKSDLRDNIVALSTIPRGDDGHWKDRASGIELLTSGVCATSQNFYNNRAEWLANNPGGPAGPPASGQSPRDNCPQFSNPEPLIEDACLGTSAP